MNIIISNSSMEPIYEQIIRQIKAMIMERKLLGGTMLPSVRNLSKDLKISALTVKKAYDQLEAQGFIVTVHGKGSFVAESNQNMMQEAQQKEVEEKLEEAIRTARGCGMKKEEIRDLFEMILEEE
ncbi:MAG: GntR family transcriptional regulator [Lachnospiraceae bacterium]|nr:GntR family transcriptional regulator [Lachnospiraceae bacterium]MBQ6995285.1 GntR family transcriptional regulator [Lachnospiraceae bacterium]